MRSWASAWERWPDLAAAAAILTAAPWQCVPPCSLPDQRPSGIFFSEDQGPDGTGAEEPVLHFPDLQARFRAADRQTDGLRVFIHVHLSNMPVFA